MKTDLVVKWVTALRSGKYRQGTGSLRNRLDGYCCLGVLCDISGRGKWELNGAADQRKSYVVTEEGLRGSSTTMVPDKLAIELGLDGDTQNHLTMLNDSGEGFGYIAGYIERNL